MPIPTEAIGSIPRTEELRAAAQARAEGRIPPAEYDEAVETAVRETIAALEATGSPVVTDGEQGKPDFATYPIDGLANLAPDGATIRYADGHTRQLPRLRSGPFRYHSRAGSFVERALRYAHRPLKQAVISPSALSLLYPEGGLDGYRKDAFLEDLTREAEMDIRSCLEKGAYRVQLDLTEARLSVKLDPSKQLLRTFIDLNNDVLARFSSEERQRIGIHTCPGGDRDSTHSLDVDYAELLPQLFQLAAGNFYMQLASEPNRRHVLQIVRESSRPEQRVFVGVIDPLNPRVESPEEVRDRVLEAAEYIPIARLGTTDDCGFAPFADDLSTARETALAKIRSRVAGTEMAARALGV